MSFTLSIDPFDSRYMDQYLWTHLRLSFACFLQLPLFDPDFSITVRNITTASSLTTFTQNDDLNSGDVSDCSQVTLPSSRRLIVAGKPRAKLELRGLTAATTGLVRFVIVLPIVVASGSQLQAAVLGLQTNVTLITQGLAAWASAPALLRGNLSEFLLSYAINAAPLSLSSITVGITDISYTVPGIGSSAVPAAGALSAAAASSIAVGATLAVLAVIAVVAALLIRRTIRRRAQRRAISGYEAAFRQQREASRRAKKGGSQVTLTNAASLRKMATIVAGATGSVTTTDSSARSESDRNLHTTGMPEPPKVAVPRKLMLKDVLGGGGGGGGALHPKMQAAIQGKLDADDVAFFAPLPLGVALSSSGTSSANEDEAVESLADAIHATPLPTAARKRASAPKLRPGIGSMRPADVNGMFESHAPKVAGSTRETAQLVLADNPMTSDSTNSTQTASSNSSLPIAQAFGRPSFTKSMLLHRKSGIAPTTAASTDTLARSKRTLSTHGQGEDSTTTDTNNVPHSDVL